jgi:hypothetical protein
MAREIKLWENIMKQKYPKEIQKTSYVWIIFWSNININAETWSRAKENGIKILPIDMKSFEDERLV